MQEKHLTKLSFFHDKIHNKQEIEEIDFNIINDMHEKSKAKIILLR